MGTSWAGAVLFNRASHALPIGLGPNHCSRNGIWHYIYVRAEADGASGGAGGRHGACDCRYLAVGALAARIGSRSRLTVKYHGLTSPQHVRRDGGAPTSPDGCLILLSSFLRRCPAPDFSVFSLKYACRDFPLARRSSRRVCPRLRVAGVAEKSHQSRAGIDSRVVLFLQRYVYLSARIPCITKSMGKRTENVSGMTKLD